MNNYKVIFSVDYEIHGNGDGCPYKLMVEPTWRLLEVLESSSAKLTVFADIAQISKFKEYMDETGRDKFYFNKIKEQLQYCINNGHDVQLHIHSSFFKSHYNGVNWVQYWDEYNLAALEYETIYSYVQFGKSFLEDMFKPIDKQYQCDIFRAANWSMQPSNNLMKALIMNGFKIDSSVYKWGKQIGNVNYNYSKAHHQILPYPASIYDINKLDIQSDLFEVPIFCQKKSVTSFITPIRIFRALRALLHKHKKAPNNYNIVHENNTKLSNVINQLKKLKRLIFSKHPRKLDFNQLTSKQQIKVLKGIQDKYSSFDLDVPVVFIGHSKTFIKNNEKILRNVLDYIDSQDKFKYCLYSNIELEKYRNHYDQ